MKLVVIQDNFISVNLVQKIIYSRDPEIISDAAKREGSVQRGSLKKIIECELHKISLALFSIFHKLINNSIYKISLNQIFKKNYVK